MAPVTLIRAAGGVVRRTGSSGPEICLVHRPRYDDWSLPKGKLNRSEHPLAAGVREVWEETGVRAAPQCALPAARYVARGVPKVVDYWSMRVLAEEPFTPGSEVDSVRWLPVADALALLSYAHDVDVVRAFAAMPPVTGVVVLVRHASAGRRGTWPGPDRARPLDGSGVSQAGELAGLLGLFAPERLVSASPRRCVATLTPLASALDLPIEVETAFDEGADPAVAADRLRALAVSAPATVVCGQGGAIPPALAALTGGGTLAAGAALAAGDRRDHAIAKGTGWLLPFAGRTLVAATPLA